MQRSEMINEQHASKHRSGGNREGTGGVNGARLAGGWNDF